MKTFCVVGHDARQRAAAQTLQAAGFRIIGPEAACQADFVLLPMSQERVSDAVARTLQGVRPGTLLLAGRPGSPIQAAARQASLPLLDYFQRPELECLNAVPTAEGCLALLLQLRPPHHLGKRLPGSRLRTRRPGGSAAAGPAGRAYHRCRPQCRAAGQRPVCGAPRRPAGPPARAAGQAMIPSSTPSPRRCCPAKCWKSCRRGALVIDLASLPGGTDFDAAEALGIRAEHALALPGKCAPDTAGALIAQTVLTILEERGDLHE